ncbi:MAG: hypothetical protein K8L97_03905 [Anaerolineae bacterium]|nr:hypothetical protein [Anaerolineae bacterium]
MGIEVSWDDAEESIIRWDFGETWNWDDFQNAFEQSLQLALKADHRIDVIPNLSYSKVVPPSALTQFNRIQRQMPDNTTLIVITGGSVFDNAIISAFRAAYRVESWRTARTIDEARIIIHQSRSENGQD